MFGDKKSGKSSIMKGRLTDIGLLFMIIDYIFETFEVDIEQKSIRLNVNFTAVIEGK